MCQSFSAMPQVNQSYFTFRSTKADCLFLIAVGLLFIVTTAGCSPTGQKSANKTDTDESSKNDSEHVDGAGDQRFVGGSKLPLHQQAVLAFELRLTEIMNSDLVEVFISEEMLKLHGLFKKRDIKDFQTVRRITGCLADIDLSNGPETFYGTSSTQKSDAMNEPTKSIASKAELPIIPDFWIEIEFENESFVRDQILSDFNLDDQIVLFGKNFYQSSEMKALDVLVLPVDGRTLQFGTKSYFENNSANVVSQRLARLWSRTPGDAPLRIAVDGKGAVRALSGLADYLTKDSPVFLKEYINLLRLRADIVLTVDPSDQQMISLDVDADDVAGANKVLASFRKLHVMLESGAAPLINQVLKEFPDDAKAMKQLIDSLRPAVEGSTVVVQLRKPPEIEKLVRNALARGKRNLDRRTEMNRFHAVGLAIERYRSWNRPPNPFGVGRKGFHDDLSWRVVVMSGTSAFGYKRVKHDASKAWDDPANRELMRSMPRDFGTGGSNTRIVYVKRKTKNVSRDAIMLMETINPVLWTKPIDIDVGDAMKTVRSLKPGESLLVMTYDREVFSIENRFDESDLRKLFSDDLKKAALERLMFR